jgi:hypothetical protein
MKTKKQTKKFTKVDSDVQYEMIPVPVMSEKSKKLYYICYGWKIKEVEFPAITIPAKKPRFVIECALAFQNTRDNFDNKKCKTIINKRMKNEKSRIESKLFANELVMKSILRRLNMLSREKLTLSGFPETLKKEDIRQLLNNMYNNTCEVK